MCGINLVEVVWILFSDLDAEALMGKCLGYSGFQKIYFQRKTENLFDHYALYFGFYCNIQEKVKEILAVNKISHENII